MGYLMEENRMLRAMDCERTTKRRWLSPLVLASLVMLGPSTTIALGAVQTQDGKQKAGTDENPIRQVSAAADKGSVSKEFRYFQRTKVPASHPMFRAVGVACTSIWFH